MSYQSHSFDPTLYANFGMLSGEAVYRPDEVTDVLECDIGHVYDLIRLKKLRASNIGTSKKPIWRIRHSAIVAFLAENENTQTPPEATEYPRPVKAKSVRPPKTTKAKPLGPLVRAAGGLDDSFAARYAARRAGQAQGD
ncbi:helix-turn-helix domain-containing protein [Microvirga alba]|uniref:Helix-turn-helix domain-containing protein n=1 Tax=Microvirga alba TaxID=2791025 RepID=A0A931BPJ6_9HYPH|nr:helix-turn-helix domain-containing protein [Microvirga alba]MBF9234626.1 helix-turn-helix domain-containing protein [Microvirga alba]